MKNENMDNLQTLMHFLKTDHVFLTGGGGVGKSYLTSKLIKSYKEQKKQIVILGSTGISAVCIGGQTLHSFFAFGIANSEEEILRADKKRKHKLKQLNQILSKCDLIIIDEISMVSANLLDLIRYRLTQANYKGKLLFVGDFLQLPPIVKTSNDGLLGQKIYAFESLAWEFYEPKILTLTQSKRTKNLDFFNILNQIRIGEIDEKNINFLQNLRKQTEIFSHDPTILYSTNQEVDFMNSKKLHELKGELFMFMANTTIYENNLHEQKLISWKKSLIVSECLELKVGAIVLFCVNKKDSYYNGQRGIVTDITNDSIQVLKEDKTSIEVKRHEFEFSEFKMHDGEIKEICLASFSQFPLKLAYAITIHKSQGMSIEYLVCNIDKIFENSQFYVALSRATDPNKLFLYYTGLNFINHLNRCVKIDQKVIDFYDNCKDIKIEEQT